jgi:hypothetical protein
MRVAKTGNPHMVVHKESNIKVNGKERAHNLLINVKETTQTHRLVNYYTTSTSNLLTAATTRLLSTISSQQ